MMINIDGDDAQDFINWMHTHELDIANDINDFGELKNVFFAIFDRHAGDSKLDSMGIW